MKGPTALSRRHDVAFSAEASAPSARNTLLGGNAMNVADIEGIGPVNADKLAGAGVRTVEGLLERGAGRKGRQELADAAGISTGKILEWVNRADLYRVKGIGSEYSDVLELVGVDTVPELAQRNAANLHAAIVKLDQDRPNVIRRVPSESEIAGWIGQAKTLPRAIEY
jgi:predicted flap endonuclease-1-like 5' DNA nuclease